jgi:VWFA-related protein
MLKTKKVIATLNICVISLLFLTGFIPAKQTDNNSENLTARITQVDTSQFPQVTVYISATDADGEPVAISASQIIIMENGEEMTPEKIGAAGDIGPLTTILVMDVSGSMNHAGKLEAAKDAAVVYVSQSRPDDMTGLIAFNTKIYPVQELTSDQEKLYEAIDGLSAQDDTALYDALAKAIELMESVSGRRALIALTDGMDNQSKISPQEVLQMIGPEGLSISTIGLGEPSHSTSALSGLNEPALKALSEQAGGVYGYANDAESLKALYELYGRALQSEYMITYTSPSQLRDGVNRSLSVSIANTGGTSESVGAASFYNPGGLVPEVTEPASWILFAALLVGLFVLLLLPFLIGKVVGMMRGERKGSVKIQKTKTKSARIKLKN